MSNMCVRAGTKVKFYPPKLLTRKPPKLYRLCHGMIITDGCIPIWSHTLLQL